jgi:HAD superfamily hydrolase (TIGR01549 family)
MANTMMRTGIGTTSAIIFDIGETIRDDTREFASWADWLHVPRHTFSALIGAVKATGGETNDVFKYIDPEFDLDSERERRRRAGVIEHFDEMDLYPDVRTALAELKRRGYWVGIAGNQSAGAACLLRALNLPADFVVTSGELGVAKPTQAFFDHVASMLPVPRHEVLYVGDHVRQDVLASSMAGFKAALIRRGPWGRLWAKHEIVSAHAIYVIDNLTDLPDLIERGLHSTSDLKRELT